jgi:protein-tyrosine phosphatase
MPHPTRILCVCLGNICRSPTARRCCARTCRGDHRQRGHRRLACGQPALRPGHRGRRSRGYDLTAQRARQVTSTDFTRFDLILAMDRQNLADLKRWPLRTAPPSCACSSTRWAAATSRPYYTRDFDGALDLVERAATAWAEAARLAAERLGGVAEFLPAAPERIVPARV